MEIFSILCKFFPCKSNILSDSKDVELIWKNQSTKIIDWYFAIKIHFEVSDINKCLQGTRYDLELMDSIIPLNPCQVINGVWYPHIYRKQPHLLMLNIQVDSRSLRQFVSYISVVRRRVFDIRACFQCNLKEKSIRHITWQNRCN